jgi:hypothetical protein
MARLLRFQGNIISIVAAGLMLFSASAGFAQGPARSAASDIQNMTYDVYAGGLNAVEANMDIALDDDRYSFVFSAETKGFLGTVAPWEGSFETEGWEMEDGSKRPELHKSVAIWRGEKEVKEYNYAKDGSFKGLVITEEDKAMKKPDVSSDLTDQTTDALTATLEAMKQVASSGTCEGTSEIFDGKRRFELVFKHEGNEQLSPTRYNVYNGMASRCVVEIKPMGGAWHKKPRGWLSIQEQGRKKGGLPTVWFASLKEGAPAVPVKVKVKTAFGTLFMHLTEYSDGSSTKFAKKR